ncbi:BMP family lipoprotein [Kribbella solani]|uniref:Basic membrane protein A n=1 Tax=Kribbella solani TaxID=236067 RepID=A0A841DHL6_9ACTN|nr:BMP family ABC transporter substrate-binding protein [Kribbella solani]MBB5977391.1 basic membrane protein A [Kribbella solani]
MGPVHKVMAALAATVCLLTTAACGGASGGSSEGGGSGGVALLLPGTSGDGGFLDSAKAGVQTAADEAGIKAQVVEAGTDPTKWQPALDDLVAGDAKLIVTGSFAMADMIQQAAEANPDKTFVIFDASVNYGKCKCPNVYSITYVETQVGFLGGALAALMVTTPGIAKVNSAGTPAIGMVGGEEIPVIAAYFQGFKAGAKAVAPGVKVLTTYSGSFSDPVKGKAVAADLINQGAGVIAAAAGGTDKGVFEAAAARGLWAIGADKQETVDPKVGGVDTVLTAATVDVRSSVKQAVLDWHDGKLKGGTAGAYGVEDGSVSIVESPLYTSVVPAKIQNRIKELVAELKAGKYKAELTAS